MKFTDGEWVLVAVFVLMDAVWAWIRASWFPFCLGLIAAWLLL